MELSRAERAQKVVKEIAKQRGVNQQDIGPLVGYNSASAFSRVLNGQKNVPQVLLQRLAALDPRINPDFLEGISDEIFRDENTVSRSSVEPSPLPRVGIFVPPELTQMVTDMTAIIKEQQAMIRTLVDACVKKGEGN